MYSFSTKGIRSKQIHIEANGLRIPLLILKSLSEPENAPGVMWIHGGGYMTGMKEMAYIGRAADLVRNHGAVVVAPGYHLSLFHPYPTALNDCYATLLYIKDHAKELGINPDQIMVGGESAGGGLAAAISMLARDKGEVKITDVGMDFKDKLGDDEQLLNKLNGARTIINSIKEEGLLDGFKKEH